MPLPPRPGRAGLFVRRGGHVLSTSDFRFHEQGPYGGQGLAGAGPSGSGSPHPLRRDGPGNGSRRQGGQNLRRVHALHDDRRGAGHTHRHAGRDGSRVGTAFQQGLAPPAPRYGYRRIWALLRAEGWRVNRKRVYRLWRRTARCLWNDDLACCLSRQIRLCVRGGGSAVLCPGEASALCSERAALYTRARADLLHREA